MDLEDVGTCIYVGETDLDDTVEPSGSKECIVKDVGPVGGTDDLDVAHGSETVQLGQELHKRPLDLTVSGGGDIQSLGTNGVQLINEYDTGGLLLRKLEEFADEPRTLSDVLLDKLGSDQPDECCIGRIGDGLGHEGLTGSWRSDEEDTLWRFDTDLSVELGPEERILDRLTKLQHLVLQSSDVIIGDLGLLHDLRTADDGIER